MVADLLKNWDEEISSGEADIHPSTLKDGCRASLKISIQRIEILNFTFEALQYYQ